jgi:hypothetical protein
MSHTPLHPGRLFLLLLLFLTLPGCYQYRVLNTSVDPSTEYQQKVLWSSFWGLANKPRDFVVPNCDSTSAIDEIQFRTNFGYSMLTVVTLGILAPVQVRWKCHKPCPREGGF